MLSNDQRGHAFPNPIDTKIFAATWSSILSALSLDVHAEIGSKSSRIDNSRSPSFRIRSDIRSAGSFIKKTYVSVHVVLPALIKTDCWDKIINNRIQIDMFWRICKTAFSDDGLQKSDILPVPNY